MSTVDFLHSVMQDCLQENTCRVCLREEDGQIDLLDFVVTCSGSWQLKEVLAFVVKCEIAVDDILPSRMCNKCVENCISAFAFMKTYDFNIKSLEKCIDYVNAKINNKISEAIRRKQFIINVLPHITNYANQRVETSSKLGVFACTMCSLSFDDNALLELHKMQHPPGTEHICRECGNIYKNRHILNMHMLDKHKSDAVNLCVTCGKTYTTLRGLHNHQAKQHASKLVTCDACNKNFQSKKELDLHTCDDVKGKATDDTIDDEIIKREYVCEVCENTFKCDTELRTHTRSEHKILKCPKCGKLFKVYSFFEAHLKKHKKTPDELKIYKCEYCEYKTNKKFLQTCHTRRRHTYVRPYVCEVCGKGFYIRREVKLHMRVHTKEKPETCHICNKTFGNKTSLTFHTRLHTGERPYQCHLCDEAFLSPSRRGAHVRSRHEPRPQCNICLSTFTDKSVLKKHITNVHMRASKARLKVAGKLPCDLISNQQVSVTEES